jgi:hypothetical protein
MSKKTIVAFNSECFGFRLDVLISRNKRFIGLPVVSGNQLHIFWVLYFIPEFLSCLNSSCTCDNMDEALALTARTLRWHSYSKNKSQYCIGCMINCTPCQNLLMMEFERFTAVMVSPSFTRSEKYRSETLPR